jgi:membrane protein YqaA with SNARE-associated domain
MHKAMLWIQGVLVPTLGPFGLFLVAILDSSFLSIPEVNDLLVITSSSAYPGRAWIYILMATLGSVAGSSILWWIGHRGGEAVLKKRFGEVRVERTRRLFNRWGVLALAVPSALPPPMPFKVFVLSSGVFEMPWPRFVLTLLVARGLRYTFWGVMGVMYGREALELLQRFDSWFSGGISTILLVLAVILVTAGVWYLWRRRTAPAS